MKNLLFFIIFTFPIFAQSYSDSLDFDDNEPPKQNYFMVHNRVTFGGGVSFNFVNINIDPINDVMVNKFVSKKLKNNMFGIGGGGFASMMFIPNLRIGGFGFSADQKETRVIQINGQDYAQNVEIEYGYGGVSLDYLLPFIRSFGVTLGTNISFGEYNVKIYQNKTYFSWNSIGNIDNDPQIINRNIKCDFIALSPNIKIEIPLNNFIMWRFSYEYNYAIKNKYLQDDNRTIYNVPSKFNGDAHNFNTGIYFGLFNY